MLSHGDYGFWTHFTSDAGSIPAGLPTITLIDRIMITEDINRVELRGRIGLVGISDSNGTARMSLCTNRVCKDPVAGAIVETTWHNVRVDCHTVDLDELKKGRVAHVWGYYRTNRFTASDGTELLSSEVRATKCEIEDE